MRFLPALAVALLPLASVAQTDEWVRDDMSDESLWLLRTGNLAREAPRAGTLPGAPDGGSHWVMSKGDGPAYVVYFIPGRIHEVEIDTHRLAGAEGDFTLAVSTDGKLYQPLDAGAVLLDTSFGWDYRLMASDQIPENATHLLVQFPNGSTAHSLSEVWIRYTWDDALVSRFLPEPVATPAQSGTLAAHSDAELQAMIDALMPQAAPSSAGEVFPIAQEPPVAIAPSKFAAEPLRAPNLAENSAPVQFAAPDVTASATAAVGLEAELPADAQATVADAPEATAAGPESAEPQSEPEPVIEPTSSANEPKPEPTPEEKAREVTAPAIDKTPIEAPAAVDVPVEVATETEALPATAESAKEVPASAADVFPHADEPREGEVPEEVHVLPTFTLPVFVSGETTETVPTPQFESPSPATAESVVLEPAAPAIESAPAVEPGETASIESNLPAIESPPSGTAGQESPVAPQVPALVDMPAAHAEPGPSAAFAADDEPKAKPAMKMRRLGPRSKSRGTLVARG